jgi:hypothetical protein
LPGPSWPTSLPRACGPCWSPSLLSLRSCRLSRLIGLNRFYNNCLSVCCQDVIRFFFREVRMTLRGVFITDEQLLGGVGAAGRRPRCPSAAPSFVRRLLHSRGI